eukprot:NODE_1712_length_1839_cov_31.472611_g1453_i0.p1 GENE.NODE_1712_length_1839_cov_31.472611_g1453_i0~~NODE_1712_length_1839_cov_31.472611_g1453_i0.p1  ORF type:complete len:392 (+),score=65.48 NODE_1712_length_1839_cov_31.472611_g1453_i0:129-1178(+)
MSMCFALMASNLVQFRSFMPQSILTTPETGPSSPGVEDRITESKSTTNKSFDVVNHSSKQTDHSFSSRHEDKQMRILTVVEVSSRRAGAIVLVNIKQFQSIIHDSHVVAAKYHTQVLEAVSSIANRNKGLVEPFLGDHIMMTFNLVSNCTVYANMSCKTALEILNHYKTNVESWSNIMKHDLKKTGGLSIGLSQGHVNVGVMGSSNMKRLSFIGPSVNMVYLLERLCGKYKINSCCDTNLEQHATSFFYFKTIDRILFEKYNTKPILIYEVVKEKRNSGMDEWMYELGSAEKDDPFNYINSSWKLFIQGKVDEAREVLGEPQSPTSIRLSSLFKQYPNGGYVDPTPYWY